MTKKEKILKKFNEKLWDIRYRELEFLLLNLWFRKIDAKGSHIKFKNNTIKKNIIIPLHNNECKYFYKKQVHKILKNNSLI